MLLIVGAMFFSLTLYSGEIIAALVKSNLLTINLEKISDDGESKNRKILANQQLEAVTSKLENAEKLLLDSNQELSKLEIDKNGLQTEKEKLKQSIDKLKFEENFSGSRDKLIIEVFYSTGVRLSELINIKLADVDTLKSQIKVLGKRNKERLIPLTKELQKSIEAYMILRIKEKVTDCSYLFLTDSGKKLNPSMVYRKVNELLKGVTTLEKKSPHVLRHTFATHMLNNGADLNVIKELLGHASLSATEVWISEAQERMVLAVSPKEWPRLAEIARLEGVEATPIGTFTGNGQLVLRWNDEIVGDLNCHFLHEGRPRERLRSSFTPQQNNPLRWSLEDENFETILLELLRSEDVASKEWIIRQYDHEVQGKSVLKPLLGPMGGPADATVIRGVLGRPRGILIGIGLRHHLGTSNPFEMAVGGMFNPGVLMTVADLSRMEVEVDVNENDVVNIDIGDTSEIEIDAYPDTLFYGIVSEIAHTAQSANMGLQQQVTNFKVKVRMLSVPDKIRPGMSSTVNIITETIKDAVSIPIQSLTSRPENYEQKIDNKGNKWSEKNDEDDQSFKKIKSIDVVFVLEDEFNDTTAPSGKKYAVVRPLEVGISSENHYFVRSGIKLGEMIVTGGYRVLSKELSHGTLVALKNDPLSKDGNFGK